MTTGSCQKPANSGAQISTNEHKLTKLNTNEKEEDELRKEIRELNKSIRSTTREMNKMQREVTRF